MKYSYVIIDDDSESSLNTKAVASRFPQLLFSGAAQDYDDALNLILEQKPNIVFLEIDPKNKKSNLSLNLINELHRYLKDVPKIIITTKDKALAFDALKFEVLDYCIKPLELNDFRKTILKLDKSANTLISFRPQEESHRETPPEEIEPSYSSSDNTREDIDVSYPDNNNPDEVTILPNPGNKTDQPLIICVKSYGDYRFIEAKDIRYLQADNNSTDIHLNNGEMITAFKTLKHFEGVLVLPFVRIHNSYIVNIQHVSRIHTGNAVCYITNTTTKLPFSKSYKENVDSIINSIANGNYLEI